jgi:hypothetical protein
MEFDCIERDLPCRDCGYNLRGLLTGGRCPECSLPIGDSTRGDGIEFASPAWLRRLERGARHARIGCAIAGASTMAVWLLRSWLGWSSEPSVALALAIICATLAYSVFLLTSPDPREPVAAVWTRRTLARVGTPLCVANAAFTLFALHAGTPPGVLLAVNALSGPSGPIGLVTLWALTSHLRTLCLRLREPDLAASMRLLWRWFRAWAIMVNLWLLLPQLIRAIPSRTWYSLGTVLLPIPIALLALFVTIAITKLEKRLRELVQIAAWREASQTAVT